MSFNLEDVKIEVFGRKRFEVDVATLSGSFVKATHISSGIVVTVYDDRVQVKARNRALVKLEHLVSIWSREKE